MNCEAEIGRVCGALLARGPPDAAAHAVLEAVAPQGAVADRDEEETEDEAADPEPHGRRRADRMRRGAGRLFR